jgi:hypothetical protein
MNNTITLYELSELCLLKLYDLYKKKPSEYYDMNVVTEVFGIGLENIPKIIDITNVLQSKNLLDIVRAYENGISVVRINQKGIILVEEEGNTGRIRQYISKQDNFVDKSINISGNVSNSQFNINSSNVTQVNMSDKKEIQNILKKIEEMILKEAPYERRDELIEKVSEIRNELRNPNPRPWLIKSKLDIIAKFATIGSFAIGLSKLLGL